MRQQQTTVQTGFWGAFGGCFGILFALGVIFTVMIVGCAGCLMLPRDSGPNPLPVTRK